MLAIALGARLFYGTTMLGRALRATAFDREASLAVGINVNWMVGLSYAVSSMLAAVGGVLIGPLIGVSSHMGFLIGLKAFAVAIVGGLEHPVGILVAGLAYGVPRTSSADISAPRPRRSSASAWLSWCCSSARRACSGARRCGRV